MNLSPEPETSPLQKAPNSFENFRLFALLTACLVILFIKPLYDLVRFAASADLYSHILLIPFITAYFIWKQKDRFQSKPQTCPWAAALCFVAGIAALILWFLKKGTLVENDYLTLTVLAFVSFLSGIYLFSIGNNLFNTAGFPIAFLVFMVPIPIFLMNGIETFFQHASAETADAMLRLSSAPVYRNGLEFRLPNIVLAVAPECSGVRSTLVLFITSIIAGQLFLQSSWKKLLLTIFVIPLAILRNGFRIFTIAELCIHRGPEMIDSPIHRKGGPIFFLLSLVPFFLLLFFLQKSKFKGKQSAALK